MRRICDCRMAIAECESAACPPVDGFLFGNRQSPIGNGKYERPPLRHSPTAETSGVHHGGGAHPRARNWSDHGHLYSHGSGPLALAPGEKSSGTSLGAGPFFLPEL